MGNAVPAGENLLGLFGATFAHIALQAWGIAAFLIPNLYHWFCRCLYPWVSGAE